MSKQYVDVAGLLPPGTRLERVGNRLFVMSDRQLSKPEKSNLRRTLVDMGYRVCGIASEKPE